MSQSFAALGVSAPVVDVLARDGIHTPFAIQSLVLPDALAGLDVLAASPTSRSPTRRTRRGSARRHPTKRSPA